MRRLWKIPVLMLLLALLILIRQFEQELFYDPFMAFFEGGDPKFYKLQWYYNIALRFFLNSMISIAVLFVVFQKKTVAIFAAFLYLGLFVLLFPAFVLLMPKVDFEDYLSVFYIRRFLVQPLLLIILLPAFYYWILSEKDQREKRMLGD